jgi:hypothetical protein
MANGLHDPAWVTAYLPPGEADRPVAGAQEELVATAIALEGVACAVGLPAVGLGYEAVCGPVEVRLDPRAFELEPVVYAGRRETVGPTEGEKAGLEVVSRSSVVRVG